MDIQNIDMGFIQAMIVLVGLALGITLLFAIIYWIFARTEKPKQYK
ncbi:hypothetical protein [Rummeliibacillus sp. TYF-LIM-RU47]|nr:hypothetical protein [Rummeliibacillus sp. TYF-LIM-RU47]